MATKLSRAPKRDEEDRLLPLINIVFLLLIVFMIAGRIDPAEPVAITPPDSVSTTERPTEAVTVTVSRDGRITLGGTAVPLDSLGAYLDAMVEGQPVEISADAAVSAIQVIRVMERMRESGVESVTLRTERSR